MSDRSPFQQLFLARMREFYRQPEVVFWVFGFPILLAVGLVLGSVLGLLLSWLVLPFVTVTGTGAAAVPAPVIVIPWAAIVPIWALAGVLLLVTVLAVRRQLPARSIGVVLRAGDG